MMKFNKRRTICLLIFIAVFTFYDLPAQFIFAKNPVEGNDLSRHSEQIAKKGIKYKQEILYELLDGKVTTNKYVEKTTEYGVDGKIKEVVITDKTGRTRVIFIYTYAETGFLKRITKFHPTGDILGRYEFKYDKNGFLLEKTEYDQYDYVIQKVMGEVNETEKTVTEKYYKSPEMVTKTIVSKYSDLHTGRLSSIVEYIGEERFKLKSEYVYENEKIQRIHFINQFGGIVCFHEYSYDAQGFLAEIKRIVPGGASFPVNTSQFSNGFISGEILYEGKGKIKSYYKFSYK